MRTLPDHGSDSCWNVAVRVARLLSIVFEVDSTPGITAGRLAERLGVSIRTVYRDVAALQAAGVPLYGEVGRNGGLRLVEGYRSRAASLQAEEAAALLTGVVPGLAEQLGLGDTADRAARKVRAQSGTRTAGDHDAVLVDPVGWYRAPDVVPHLGVVAEAARTHTVLSIVYRRWAEPSEVRRRIEPLGLVLKAGAWYVMARSRGQLRTYRVSQIVRARPLGRSFEPDPSFDLAASWAVFVNAFRDRLHVIDAHVRLTRPTRDWIRAEGDPALVDALDAALAGAPDDDATHAVDLPFESIDRAVADIARFGRGAEVLGPPELRDAMAGLVADLARQYRTAPPARH
jgi:predicted DNA-binding transcriptional regulator YafY